MITKEQEDKIVCMCLCHTRRGTTAHPKIHTALRNFDDTWEYGNRCCLDLYVPFNEMTRFESAFYILLRDDPNRAPTPKLILEKMGNTTGAHSIGGRISKRRAELLIENGFTLDNTKNRWVKMPVMDDVQVVESSGATINLDDEPSIQYIKAKIDAAIGDDGSSDIDTQSGQKWETYEVTPVEWRTNSVPMERDPLTGVSKPVGRYLLWIGESESARPRNGGTMIFLGLTTMEERTYDEWVGLAYAVGAHRIAVDDIVHGFQLYDNGNETYGVEVYAEIDRVTSMTPLQPTPPEFDRVEQDTVRKWWQFWKPRHV